MGRAGGLERTGGGAGRGPRRSGTSPAHHNPARGGRRCPPHRRGRGAASSRQVATGLLAQTSAFATFDGGRGRGNDGVYLRGETRLTREAGDAEQGLGGFFRLGLAVAAAFTSSEYRRQVSSDRHEVALELTYRKLVTGWLTVQPSVHYIVSPGADPAIRDSLALGLRTELSVRF